MKRRGWNIVRIGAYQFAVSNSINHNYEVIKKAIIRASADGIKLLVFPECALTGYPPRDIESSSVVDFQELDKVYDQLQDLINENEIHVIIGTIFRKDNDYYNSTIILKPNQDKQFYHKRALWGWDRDNFCVGSENGIFEIDGCKIGVRICFEVRFPEFFRELYMDRTRQHLRLYMINQGIL